MKRWTFTVIAILAVSSAMFAIDFETIFRDLDDPVEVVFVMDTTGSMGSYIAGVRDNVTGFAEALADSGYGYRFGATTFGDGTNTWDFDPIAPGFNMTPDVDTFRAQVAITGATGGGDTPETQIDGIYDAATLYDWTPGTLHVMIMFTNSDFHFPGDGFPYSDVTYSDLITLLITRGFLVYTSYPASMTGWSVPDADSIYDLIADTTGGCSFDLGSRSPASWETIFDYVRGDIMTYYSLSTKITGLIGHNIEEIELGLLPEMTTFGPRIIDLSGPEYIGVDEIYVAWTMHLTGTPMTGSPYVITLRTDTDDFPDAGVLNYKTSMGINDGIATPEDLAISAYPNPFNSAVSISVGAIHELPLQIEIYDIAGRRVANLGQNRSLSGAETTFADNSLRLRSGSDLREYIWQPDATIGSGVYLVRATSPQHTASAVCTKRIVYIK